MILTGIAIATAVLTIVRRRRIQRIALVRRRGVPVGRDVT